MRRLRVRGGGGVVIYKNIDFLLMNVRMSVGRYNTPCGAAARLTGNEYHAATLRLALHIRRHKGGR
jgi:hypothetical protein